jgi:hypothetical protein
MDLEVLNSVAATAAAGAAIEAIAFGYYRFQLRRSIAKCLNREN